MCFATICQSKDKNCHPGCPELTMNYERRVVALLRDLVAGGGYPDFAENYVFSDVCGVASRYALLPWSLTRLSASDVPDALRLPAAAAAELELIRGTLLLHDLRDVVGWLEQAGIRSIPIKGAALLAMTPDAPGWRHTEDIDLLVEPGMVHAAEQLLQERNLPLVHPTGALLVDGTPAELGYVSDMHHVYPRRLPRGTPVELHSRPPESDLRWDELWEHAVEAAIGVRVPSPQHQLEILSRHVFRHHYGQVPMVARHCVDVKAILETSPLEGPMSPDVQFSLWLVRALSAPPGPERWLAQRLALPEGTGVAVRERIMFVFEQNERIRRDLKHRPAFLLRKLWPHEAFMEQEWGAANSPWQKALRHGRRWKALLMDAKSRGPGGSA